jgi:agmatinase
MSQNAAFDYLPACDAFLDPDRADSAHPQNCKAVVIPFGLEATVSYGCGTAKGPAAILAASHQLELFDEELWRQPVDDYGIATLRPMPIATPVEAALKQLSGTVDQMLEGGRFPLVLGGEHSLTAGGAGSRRSR